MELANSKTAFPFSRWLFLAFILRTIACFTNVSWQHPDDWFQTLEFASLFHQGVMAYSQELVFHMRNLTWPFLLSWILNLTQWIFPNSVYAKIFFVQFFISTSGLTLLWFWKLKLENIVSFQNPKPSEKLWLHFAFFFPAASWFVLSDFISPSQENISLVFLFLTLGLIEKRAFFWAGISAFAIGGVRYPNGLLSLGIGLALTYRFILKRDYKRALTFYAGVALGIILFGVCDFIYYGRPYESLWMYYQYNVKLGLGAENFGEQSFFEYWVYFKGHLWRVMNIAFFPFIFLILVGVLRALIFSEPWAFALVFYLIPHLFIGHKEGRFLRGVEFLLIFGGVEACLIYRKRLEDFFKQTLGRLPQGRKVLVFILFGLSISNFIFLLGNLRGTLGKPLSTYMDVSSLIEEYQACGYLTVRLPSSLLVSKWNKEKAPDPAFGFFYAAKDEEIESQLERKGLFWFERLPECGIDQKILLHLHKADVVWKEEGCELIPTGIQKWWKLTEENIRGPWYVCEPKVLSRFKNQDKIRGFVKALEPLPLTFLRSPSRESMEAFKADFEKRHEIRIIR